MSPALGDSGPDIVLLLPARSINAAEPASDSTPASSSPPAAAVAAVVASVLNIRRSAAAVLLLTDCDCCSHRPFGSPTPSSSALAAAAVAAARKLGDCSAASILAPPTLLPWASAAGWGLTGLLLPVARMAPSSAAAAVAAAKPPKVAKADGLLPLLAALATDARAMSISAPKDSRAMPASSTAAGGGGASAIAR